MPSRRQMPVSDCQPLGKMVTALARLPFGFWCGAHDFVSSLQTFLCFPPAERPPHTRSGHLSQALPPPAGDFLGRKRPFSLPTKQASKHDQNNPPAIGDCSCGSLGKAPRTAEICSLLTPTRLNTHTCISPRQCLSLWKAQNSLLYHVEDLKARSLNYLLINWLSCCQARLLEAESLYYRICLLLRPTLTNYKYLSRQCWEDQGPAWNHS